MNKLGIIIKREYLTRVKKKSFLIITFLGPIFFVALMIAPTLLALNSDKMESKKAIAVLDETGWFYKKFENTEANTFVYHNSNFIFYYVFCIFSYYWSYGYIKQNKGSSKN